MPVCSFSPSAPSTPTSSWLIAAASGFFAYQSRSTALLSTTCPCLHRLVVRHEPWVGLYGRYRHAEALGDDTVRSGLVGALLDAQADVERCRRGHALAPREDLLANVVEVSHLPQHPAAAQPGVEVLDLEHLGLAAFGPG
jgi:hypothetical protein